MAQPALRAKDDRWGTRRLVRRRIEACAPSPISRPGSQRPTRGTSPGTPSCDGSTSSGHASCRVLHLLERSFSDGRRGFVWLSLPLDGADVDRFAEPVEEFLLTTRGGT
jgi:hypothetical protein